MREIKLCTKYYIDAIGMVEQFLFRCNTIIRRPASALLDKLLGPPGPGVPQPQAKEPPGPGGHNNLSNSVLEGFFILFHHFIDKIYVYLTMFK